MAERTGYYERLGEFLRDRLNSDTDPFAEEDPEESGAGFLRRAGNTMEKRNAPKKAVRLVAVPRELAEVFRILGLRPGEPLAECKAAWKLLLQQHHPDKYAGASETARQTAEQTTRNVTQAYRRIAHWFSSGKILPRE